MRKLAAKTRTAIAATLLLASANSMFASIVGSDVVHADGTVTYSYVVDNRAGSFDIAAWSLEFGFTTPDWNQLDTISGGDVLIPNPGWFADAGIPITGKSDQDFISLSSESDVAVGQRLYGFSFTSHIQPGTVTFDEFSADGAFVSGTTVGPETAVPEASSVFQGVGCLLIVGGAMASRSRRAQKEVSATI